MSHAKRPRLHYFEQSTELSFLEKKILKYLHDHSPDENAHHETLKIAQGIGMKTKKDINPSIYSLEKKGFVEKVNVSPPKWRLLGEKEYSYPQGATHNTHYLQSQPSIDPSLTPSTFTYDDYEPNFSEEYQRTARVGGQEINPVIPPYPAQLLNDPTSQFCRFTLQESSTAGQSKIKESVIKYLQDTNKRAGMDDIQESSIAGQSKIEESIIKYLQDNNKRAGMDDIQKISDGSIAAINNALANLVQQRRVEKIGRDISLVLVNNKFIGAETTPIENYTPSDQIFGYGSPSSACASTIQTLTLPEGKNAISALNEYAQARRLGLEYEESMSGPDHQRIFHTIAILGRRKFRTMNGKSKKEAKLKAAEAALSELKHEGEPQSSLTLNYPINPGETIYNRIESLVSQKYNHLVQQLPDMMTGRKIFAGFVISKPDAANGKTMEVISIGSGNRCVAGDKLSLRGETVNDCHAEIIARRGLIRFLYRQIVTFLQNPQTDAILESVENRLRVKPGIEFHLYISTAPCGDSAIFAPSDSSTDTPYQHPSDCMHHPIFENKKQGLLRTKVENGEGCIPIEEGTSQPTWDGLLRGERLRTMSCSDKIAKWNFLGLQGALLTHFMEPIYMSTLTLGMLYNHRHLTRAVCCRVEKFLSNAQVGNIPDGYQVHHPTVNGQQNQNRETGKIKTREFSLNWCLGDRQAEVLDGTQGKCEERFRCTNPPRLCKAELYKQFQGVCEITREKCEGSYYKNKMAAINYQQAKNIFVASFDKSGFGKWMHKPKEEKDF